jgi:hypothetical protein
MARLQLERRGSNLGLGHGIERANYRLIIQHLDSVNCEVYPIHVMPSTYKIGMVSVTDTVRLVCR